MPPSASSKSPFFSRTAPVKAPALVAEELALQEGLGQRPAVDRHEAAAGARARVVDGAGDQLLAGAALAVDEDRRAGPRHAVDEREDGLHARALADDVVEGVLLLELAAQIDVLVHQLGASRAPSGRRS